MPTRAVLIALSSDIGSALSQAWLRRGWQVEGTFRTHSQAVDRLEREGARVVPCDLLAPRSIEAACARMTAAGAAWDVLTFCPGTLDPVGSFVDCRFDDWEQSVQVNFVGVMRLLHRLLPARRRGSPRGPLVIFFAGGGTNNAVSNYSAYTISKIALMKMCELLDAEVADTRFVIVGPGWVQTKIHDATLRAGTQAGEHYQRTRQHLEHRDGTPMEDVVACCDWLLDAPRDVIGGRNFSVVNDGWGTDALARQLRNDPNLYKLRRHGNDRAVVEGSLH